MISKEDRELMDEVTKDPIALELLKNKCRWEAMSRYAVLKEWGDPRKWATYKEVIESFDEILWMET